MQAMRLIAMKLGSVMLLSACSWHGEPPARESAPSPSPVDASYMVDGSEVRLRAGRASRPAAPGSAASIATRVVGEPALGDLDDDGDLDAVVWLAHETGGSGTFLYAAAARAEAGGFQGSPAVLLGDRLRPLALSIRHGVVFASVLDRPTGVPMAAPPQEPRLHHLLWAQDGLKLLDPPQPGEVLLQGELVIGHEVRSFRPCGATDALWLDGAGTALPATRDAYRAAMIHADPYASLFVTLIGRLQPAPLDGFGADYPGGFEISGLVNLWPTGHCGEGPKEVGVDE